MKISLGRAVIDGIPLLLMLPAKARALPLVFYLHGFTSDKESGLALGEQLARRGYAFASPDAWAHGERYDPIRERALQPEHQHYPSATFLDEYVLTIQAAAHTARDVSRLLDHFTGDPRVDVARCGVTGVSMGGFAAFLAAASEPRLRCAAPALAHPCLSEAWENLILEVASQSAWAAQVEAARPHTREVAAWMQSIDPFERLRSFSPRPLFLLNGDIDPYVPKLYCVRLYHALKPLYNPQPENLVLNIYDGVGHAFTPPMQTDVITWLERSLQ